MFLQFVCWLLLHLWLSSCGLQCQAECVLISCAYLTHLPYLPIWVVSWCGSVVSGYRLFPFPLCSVLSTKTRIRYSTFYHLLWSGWLPASYLPALVNNVTMFWWCLLCSGKTVRLISLLKESSHDGQAELLLQHGSKEMSTRILAV